MGNDMGGGVISNQTQQTIYYLVHSKQLQPFQKITTTHHKVIKMGKEKKQFNSQEQQINYKIFENTGFYALKSKRISTMGLKFNGTNPKVLSIISETGQKILDSVSIDRVQQMRLIIQKNHNVKKINKQDSEKLIKIGMKLTIPGNDICIICNNDQEAAKKGVEKADKIVCSNCQIHNKVNYICRAYPLTHIVCTLCYKNHRQIQTALLKFAKSLTIQQS